MALTWFTALPGAFQFDDWRIVVADERVHSWPALLASLPGIRPLTRATYALNWWLDPTPAGFVAFNLLCHFVSALLVLALARRWLRDLAPGPPARRLGRAARCAAVRAAPGADRGGQLHRRALGFAVRLPLPWCAVRVGARARRAARLARAVARTVCGGNGRARDRLDAAAGDRAGRMRARRRPAARTCGCALALAGRVRCHHHRRAFARLSPAAGGEPRLPRPMGQPGGAGRRHYLSGQPPAADAAPEH